MSRPSRSTVFVFLAIAVLLILIRAQPAFPDPDSFYHAKVALMIRDHGFIHAFPWLKETIMADRYVDAHWLYHVLTIPFLTVFDPLVGMRVSAVVFGLLVFYVLYRFLKSIGSPFPEWLTLVGALSADFIQRMSMPKAGSLSVAFTMLAAFAMSRAKPRLVFLIAVAFVWLYHGWPVLLAVYACLVAGDFVARRLVVPEKPFAYAKTGLATVLGLIVGNVVNPYARDSMSFSVTDIFHNALSGAPKIPVGTEWYPQPWMTMFQNDILAFCLLAFAVAMLLSAGAMRQFDLTAQKTRNVFFLLFLMSVFAAFTFRSVRFMEYLIPFLLLTAGAILSVAEPFVRKEIQAYRNGTGTLATMVRAWPRAFGALFLIACLALGSFGANAVDYAVDNRGYFSASQYEGGGNWLRENVTPGATVFNPAWDSSMTYYYFDDTHYYIVGLDPRFMYDQDKDRYQTWFDLQAGTDADVSKIQSVFGASAVVVDRRLKTDFVKNLDASGLYEMKYEDEWTQIYLPKEIL